MCFEPNGMYRKARETEEAGRLSRVVQPALAVLLLLFSVATEGQAAISGPALVGSVTIIQVNATDATFIFAGQCKGKTANFSMTLSNFNVSNVTAANLEGLSLPGQGPGQCLSQQGGEDLTVVTVVTPQFVNQNGVGVNAGHVVILYVVP